MTPARINWPPVIRQAKEIVESYETSVTLRQLFLRDLAAAILRGNRTPER